ncbi:hypothetical protein ABG067_008418, partial [Albugo candida]
MLKTEKDLQESRSIVAQLRLRGEQRAARGRRAAAAAAAASVASSTPGPDKNNNSSLSGKTSSKEAGHHTVNNKQQRKKNNMIKSSYQPPTMNDYTTASNTSPSFYFTQSNSASPVDFIHPSNNYYFQYSSHPQYNHIGTDTTMTPICGGNDPSNNNNNPSSAPFTMMVGSDWPLLNDLPHNTTVYNNNNFVDPMIIAAAEHGIAPPLLS